MKHLKATLLLKTLLSAYTFGQAPIDTLIIEEVVVTGSRMEKSNRTLPMAITVVSNEQIEMTHETAILPVLSQRIPGLFVTERGVAGFGVGPGSAGQISMRGIGGTAPNTHILVLIDGQPQFQGIFSHPLPDTYVTSDIERVEVIRGPASIIYGSNAMGGVINLITKSKEEEGLSGNARLSYGSFGTQNYMARAGFRSGRLNLFASINHNRTNGHRENSDFRASNATIKAKVELSENIDVSVDFGLDELNSNDPGSIANPALFGIDVSRGRAAIAVRNEFGNTNGGLNGFYNFGTHNFTNGWVSEDFHAGISLYQGFSLFEGNQVTLGADYMKVSGIANNVPPTVANIWKEMYSSAAYAYIQQLLFGRFTPSLGLRVENNSMFGSELIPQAGVSIMASRSVTIKGSISKGFRNPSIMELFLFAPNPNLRPERLWNYELGLNYISPNRHFNAEITAFLVNADNIIEVVPPPPPPAMRQNIGSFTNMGIEAKLDWTISPNFNFLASYSLIDKEQQRVALPDHLLFVEAIYNHNNIRASLSARHISGLYLQTGTAPLKESFTVVNLMASYRINTFFEIFAGGKNLLNQNYSIINGYPMPERHYLSGINIRF